MRRQWFTFVRLSNSYMPKSRSGFLTITFTTAAFRTEAAYGCLKPAPTSRLRRAYLHLKYSIVLSKQALSWHKLPTSPRDDAVIFSYGDVANSDRDSHPANGTPSRAYIPRLGRGDSKGLTERYGQCVLVLYRRIISQ
jgi:hypothetical protein